MTFSDLDDDFATAGAAITPESFASLPAPWLSNGYYTLTFPDGSHRTYRVRLEKNGKLKGQRTLSLLIGPDNTQDYEKQGTVGPDGFKLWRRFNTGKFVEHTQLLWDIAKGEVIEGYELLVSKRCRLCNRPLTDSESIRTEMGPTCRERMGVA